MQSLSSLLCGPALSPGYQWQQTGVTMAKGATIMLIVAMKNMAMKQYQHYHLTVTIAKNRKQQIAKPMYLSQCIAMFLDTVASLAPTPVIWLVDWLVGDTHTSYSQLIYVTTFTAGGCVNNFKEV